MTAIPFKQSLQLWGKTLIILKNSARHVSIFVFVAALIESLMTLLALYAVKMLVDSIGNELSTQSVVSSSSIITILVVTGLAFLLAALAQNLGAALRMRQGFLVSDYVDKEIHDRAISVGLRFYESPEYYDALQRAREGGSRRPAEIVTNFVTTLRAVVTIIGIFILIGSIELVLLPILIVPIAIALYIRLFFARRLFNWRMGSAQKERRASYLDFVMTHASHAKDLRINRIGPFFRDQYGKLRRELRGGEIRIEQARLWSDFSMALLGVVVFIGTSSWLLQQSLEQSRPIGDVVLFVLLLRRAQLSGNEVVGNLSKIVDDHLFLQRLFEFLSAPQQTVRSTTNLPVKKMRKEGLALSNVSFRYDGRTDDTLKNVSLRVAPGKIIALVGENGSGKTTLIKLLARLYDPTAGVITLDGIDIRDFDPYIFRGELSVVFQDYAIYADTVTENIRLGDIERAESQESIKSAAKNAGASEFIEALPSLYQTRLTKIFDNGQDLSIGQWQRLALARSLYKTSRFLILDEPTSAMDAKAEFDLFQNFKSRIGGRGALIISHRLSTVRQADYIYVLSNGEIQEHGTHDELLAKDLTYAKLFKKQAFHYR